MSDIERRRLLAAVAAAGAAIPLVAACGGDDSTNPDSGNTSEETTAPAETESAEPTPSDSASPTEESQGGGNALAKTSEIPVGGGKILDAEKIVITQPTAGDFKAFTNVCTHRGCPVRTVEGGTINCTCHGSKFKITDGSVATGPATQPLAAKNITVNGDSITLA